MQLYCSTHAGNMSNYQILKNADFDDDDDNDDDVSTATNVNPITAAATHTANHNDLLKHTNSLHHQQNFQNHYFDDADHDDKNVHKQKLRAYHDRDLLQYTNTHNNSNSNNNNIIENNQHNIHDNNSDDTPITSSSKNIFTDISISPNNLMTPLDCGASVGANGDYTMEVPLLQHNCNKSNKHGDKRNSNCNHKHHFDFECVCLCQQKGFAFNLNNNSTQSAKSKILWAVALCCIFMVVEFLGGYIAGSLAVMTDAAHLASDCISFVIGLVAIWLGCKPPDAKMSFGYKRFEVMGAIVSILGIWILTATLVLVAIQRIYLNDYDLNANSMMSISAIGILINIIMIFILHTSVLDLPAGSIGSSHGHSHSDNHYVHHGHSHSGSHTSTPTYRTRSNDSGHLHMEYATSSLFPIDGDDDAMVNAGTDAIDTSEATSIELSSAPMVLNGNLLKYQQDGDDKNLNLRAAMIHVIGDLVQSFGVFLAAVLIKIFPKAAFLDPLCTLLFSVIVIMTTTNLFKESVFLLMDSVPQGLSINDLEIDLLNIEGVKSVHHLNVWNNASNYSILMAHLIIDIRTDSNTVLMKATQLAGSAKYNIKHCTIQIERMT